MTPTDLQVRNWFHAARTVQIRTSRNNPTETTIELVGGPVEMIGKVLYGAVQCHNGKYRRGFACISVGPRGGVRLQHERYDV